MRWWLYERWWLRFKRWWTEDPFIGVRLGTRDGIGFIVVGRVDGDEFAIREVGRFGTTGSVHITSEAPLTKTKIAGFGNVGSA